MYTARYNSCRSPFLKLTDIFGDVSESTLQREAAPAAFAAHIMGIPIELIVKTPASPCFKKYLNCKDQKIDIDDLKANPMEDCVAFEHDTYLVQWRVMYDTVKRHEERFPEDSASQEESVVARKTEASAGVVGCEEPHDSVPTLEPGKTLRSSMKTVFEAEFRKVDTVDLQREVLQALFKHTLSSKSEDREKRGEDMKHIYSWSFCRNAWVDRSKIRHCTKCNQCYEDAWHCETCGTCKAGRQLACNECGGWSRRGAERGLDGELAVDEDTLQATTTSVSRKRGRRRTEAGQSAETSARAPDDMATKCCACKNHCQTRTCVCRKWGKGCSDHCNCKPVSWGCSNIMNDCGSYYFGAKHADLRLKPCVVEAQERACKRDLVHVLDFADLEARLLKDKGVFEGRLLDQCEQLEDDGATIDPNWAARLQNVSGQREDDRSKLSAWYAKYKIFEPDQPARDWSHDRNKHTQWLFRYALAEEPDVYKKFHFLYCRSTWYTDFDLHHCVACKTCRNPYEWHCGVCRKCATHYNFACDGCGGVSSTVSAVREENRRRAEEARAQEARADAESSQRVGQAGPSLREAAASSEDP